MDEIVLIDMMSELNPELLQNNYMEKDMKRGKFPLVNIFFHFRKNPKIKHDSFFETPFSEDITTDQKVSFINELDTVMDSGKSKVMNDVEIADEIGVVEGTQDMIRSEESTQNNQDLTISIYTKKFPGIIKIISGVTAASLVVSGIVLVIIKHHKGVMI